MTQPKTAPSVADMSPEALQSLIDKAQKALPKAEKARQSAIVADVKALADKHGITVAEVAKLLRPKRKRPTGTPVTHPKTGETWSGLGRKPAWVKELQAT